MTLILPSIGDLFDQRYMLLEQLGSGGIGTVFKANQIDADRLVALKILHAHIVMDEEFKVRFLREAQSLGKLSHTNIVTVYHMNISETGLPYLVMELIKGSSLRHHLADGKPMAAGRVFRIMKQLCSALACIHDAGIIHRDLKPENIVLLNEPDADSVKIIDFGLVKMETAVEQQNLTATGVLIGSLHYMSPEQCQGRKADARSDIYALTVCMYEMLNGGPPFSADTPMGIMYKHANLEAPELRLQTGQMVNPKIAEFVRKGLEKDPSKRFQSAHEMEEELSSLLEIFSGASIAGARELNPRWMLIASVGLLLLLGGMAAWQIHSTKLNQSRSADLELKATKHKSKLSYVQEVVNRRGSDSKKIEDLLAFKNLHPSSAESVEASRAALKIALRGKDQLAINKTRVQFAYEAERLNMLNEAIETLEGMTKFDQDNPPPGSNSGLILEAKGVGALAYLQSGNNKEALRLAEQVASFQPEIPGRAAETAMIVLVKNAKTKSAENLVAHVNTFNSLQHCLMVASAEKQYKVCDFCIAKMHSLLSSTRIDLRPGPDNPFQVYVTEAGIWFSEGKVAQARKQLQSIYNDPTYKDIIKNGEHSSCYDLAVSLRNVGFLDEAEQALSYLNPLYPKALVQADIMVQKKQFAEARKLLSAQTKVLDPETGIHRTAVSRLNDIESGKADYKKGLNRFP